MRWTGKRLPEPEGYQRSQD
ncbi:hypothetical protein F383_09255 [Gossypium arboreum]|uniref:Uncharacterized protein n=1 Tax=Gossypium arboreum TaxID=29729 RepID=A0A0B0PNI6_GOSAR|nr:hypothetical protein F383_09255 [Gossypium arboreum]